LKQVNIRVDKFGERSGVFRIGGGDDLGNCPPSLLQVIPGALGFELCQ
jgi:hypothetical protein